MNKDRDTYLWARHPAETDPTNVSKSCTKNTHCNSRKLALVWHPRSKSVGPRIATPIPKLPNTRQSVITDTQFSLNRARKWGLLSPFSVTRGSKVVGVVAMTFVFLLANNQYKVLRLLPNFKEIRSLHGCLST